MKAATKIKRMLEKLKEELPLKIEEVDLTNKRVGLVIVDVVNGFCKPGAGILAPPTKDPEIEKMIKNVNSLAWQFAHRIHRPILFFADTHESGKPEPPYPPHCEKGTGEEELVDELKWLENLPDLVTIIRKGCINNFIGGIDKETGNNKVLEWIDRYQIEALVVTGICTDICVMQFVQTILSARNHGLVPSLKDIVACANCCATYDLPKETALALGLPETAAHPREITHYMGLYFMAASGAILADVLKLDCYRFLV